MKVTLNIPVALSLLRLALSPIFFVLVSSRNSQLLWLSLAVFTIAVTSDWLDGFLARRWNETSEFGAFFDPIADKILTGTAFYSLYTLGVVEQWMFLSIVARDLLTTALRLLGSQKNIPVVTMQSAKVKTFLQMTLMFLTLVVFCVNVQLDNYDRAISILKSPIFQISFWAVTIFTLYTGFEYVGKNRKLLERNVEQ